MPCSRLREHVNFAHEPWSRTCSRRREHVTPGLDRPPVEISEESLTQRCPLLRPAPLHRLPTPDRSVRDHVPHPSSTSNKTPYKTSSTTDLKPLAPVPRSRAILAISLIAASANSRSAPWNRTSLRYC